VPNLSHVTGQARHREFAMAAGEMTDREFRREAGAFLKSGDADQKSRDTRSRPSVDIFFCADCGPTLFVEPQQAPEVRIAKRSGALPRREWEPSNPDSAGTLTDDGQDRCPESQPFGVAPQPSASSPSKP
jgi:hypothetical protein